MNGIGKAVPPVRSHRAIAVTDVTVHTMDGRGTLSGQTVVIEAGRISRMGRVSDVWRGCAVTDSPISSGNRKRAMRRIPFTVVALLGLLVSACAATAPVPTTPPSSQGGEPSVPADGGSACDEAFAAAAAVGVTVAPAADVTQDTVEHLYPTVRACESVVVWVGGVEANRSVMDWKRGDVRVFLGNVCGSRTTGLEGTELCQQVLASCGEEPVWEMTLACASPSSRRDHGDGEVWG